MQKLLGALTAATLFVAACGDAVAFPIAVPIGVLKAAPGGDIVPVAQGCGERVWRAAAKCLAARERTCWTEQFNAKFSNF
jgi:hypothetical protein